MANLFFFQGPCEDGKQIVDVTYSSKLMEKHVLGSACLKHFCPGENQVSSSSSRDNNNCNIGCLTISYDKTVMTDDDKSVAYSMSKFSLVLKSTYPTHPASVSRSAGRLACAWRAPIPAPITS